MVLCIKKVYLYRSSITFVMGARIHTFIVRMESEFFMRYGLMCSVYDCHFRIWAASLRKGSVNFHDRELSSAESCSLVEASSC